MLDYSALALNQEGSDAGRILKSRRLGGSGTLVSKPDMIEQRARNG
jgi:hypothetical protein